MALRPPDRHIAISVRSGANTLFTRDTKSGSIAIGNWPLAASHSSDCVVSGICQAMVG